ncbi:MAG: response regulator [Thermomicrobiales bacterium]|jgi:two-component system response regulator NreC|nr:response regulator transcription factor [Thermomicrobiales bacterium]
MNTLRENQLTRPIRVLLADDHGILRAGLRALLGGEADMEVVGEAADGEEAVERATELDPDVVVLDIAMPRLDGLEATRRIRDRGLHAKVLILTVHAEERYLLPVLRAGGAGYVQKSGADTDLLDAIRTVARGDAFLYPGATRLLLADYLGREGEGRDRGRDLSERERQVLALTAEGYSAQEIGDRLILSPKTVETYRERAMHKLGLRRRADLVHFALRSGLLQSPDGGGLG